MQVLEGGQSSGARAGAQRRHGQTREEYSGHKNRPFASDRQQDDYHCVRRRFALTYGDPRDDSARAPKSAGMQLRRGTSRPTNATIMLTRRDAKNRAHPAGASTRRRTLAAAAAPTELRTSATAPAIPPAPAQGGAYPRQRPERRRPSRWTRTPPQAATARRISSGEVLARRIIGPRCPARHHQGRPTVESQ